MGRCEALSRSHFAASGNGDLGSNVVQMCTGRRVTVLSFVDDVVKVCALLCMHSLALP